MTSGFEPGPDRTDPDDSSVLNERRQLINVAYRLLGSLTEAEDAVQETYARWYSMSAEQQHAIESPGAWLTTVASHICLDQLRSARARRERYLGEWIPEPLPDPTEWLTGNSGGRVPDPADCVTLDESVHMAFLVVLDSMTPAERVTFILHDVFRFPFSDVGRIVGRTPVACRQLATSARRRLNGSPHLVTSTTDHGRAVAGFKEAWEARDLAALMAVLDPAATVIADGGGLVNTVLHPIRGGAQIARYYVNLAKRLPTMTMRETTVNGQPGLVGEDDGRAVTVYAFAVINGLITHMWAVRNPDKLHPWTVE